MTVRTASRQLTAEALASGLKEQYAVLRRRGRVVVELTIAADSTRFEVSEIVTNGANSTAKIQTFTNLNEARAEFARLVRNNP